MFKGKLFLFCMILFIAQNLLAAEVVLSASAPAQENAKPVVKKEKISASDLSALKNKVNQKQTKNIPPEANKSNKGLIADKDSTNNISIQEKESPKNISTGLEKVKESATISDWNAKAGTTLRTLLLEWGERAGWTVIWNTDRDYNLEAGVVFRGRFVDVASALIRSFARVTPPPMATFYKGNRVLVITVKGDENVY